MKLARDASKTVVYQMNATVARQSSSPCAAERRLGRGWFLVGPQAPVACGNDTPLRELPWPNRRPTASPLKA